MGVGVNPTPRPHFTPRKDPVPILQEAGWAPGPVWTGEKSHTHWDAIPDRPAHNSVAIPTELPGLPHLLLTTTSLNVKGIQAIKIWRFADRASQYLTNLTHKICFTISFISCLYMFRAHVLIIRRLKLHYTASGIITPIPIPEAV